MRKLDEIVREFENKIADLKANFDYVLEGKDLEIKKLKMTDEYIIKTLESKVEKLQEDLRNKRISIKNKKAEIQELERLNSNQAESLRVTMLEEEKKGKRIEELEKENSELRNNGFTVSAMTEQQLKVALEKGEQLEKENEVLKHNKKTVAHLADCLEEKMKERIEELETRCTELFLQNNEFAERFEKSIGIIKELLSCCRNYPQENAEKMEQAEQFIKEIEK